MTENYRVRAIAEALEAARRTYGRGLKSGSYPTMEIASKAIHYLMSPPAQVPGPAAERDAEKEPIR
jgi:hypothetical protein